MLRLLECNRVVRDANNTPVVRVARDLYNTPVFRVVRDAKIICQCFG